MINEQIRPYEISLWNLLDSFITVLKAVQLETLGTIEEPKMTLSDDGTENLSFTIPMYILEKDEKLENPIWYNVKNGNLIANMRKLKVTFNPGTNDEDTFDFLITKITENHEEGKLTCEIEAEGLPFHELGKLGTRISLSADLYYDEYDAWIKRKEAAENEFTEEAPVNNISYWNEKIGFQRWIDGEYHDPGLWYYDILMDWTSYANASERLSDKIYEEAYASSWSVENNIAVPIAIESYREKYRMIETSDSNYYNITLDIASEFGVFCRYKYEYDDNHHIIARKIIYYNNFINDKEGKIDFSYPFQSSQISREMDSTDIITKMYVDTVLDENIVIEDISITNSNANLSKEDYLLNFDYLYSIGAIDKDLYDKIAKYEALMHTLNKTIIEADDYLLKLRMRLPELEAAVTLAKAGKQAAINGIDETNALLEAISSSDGNNDGIISGVIKTGYLVANKNTSPLTYNISITEKGVIQNTIKMYDEYDYADPANPFDETNHKLVSTGWKYEYDEFGNLIKINNITKGSSDSNTVYLQYDYSPSLYYKRIINIWTLRLAKDEDIIDTNTRLIATINTNIANKKTVRQDTLTEKERIKLNFTKLMGPALREGKWTPENNLSYNKKKGLDSILLLSDKALPDREDAVELFWDKTITSSEILIYTEEDIGVNRVYYPCIKIDDDMLNYILRHLNENLCVIYEFRRTILGESNEENIVLNYYYYRLLGSQSKFVFINDGADVFPAIIITKEIIDNLDGVLVNIFLGTIITETKEDAIANSEELSELYKITISSQYLFNNNNWVNLAAAGITYTAVYPRFKLSEKELILNLGSNDYGTNLDVSLNNLTLDPYNDYYTFTGDDGYTTFISFKPTQLIFNGKLFSNDGDAIHVAYYVSTASTAYYLDAREVLKENSTPKVSYNASISILNTNFMKTAYKKLNRIININDYELKFEDVQGYISSIDLNLDAPWEDTIEVKNYKTKFEDLFSSIVASTEAMQLNTAAISAAAAAINRDGTIKDKSLLSALDNAYLNYTFNNGALSITNDKGIESISEGGIVAIRKGGIFTATDKDESNAWIWNSGITPLGINALMITVGLLDTNKIIVLAGDLIKFLLNEKGLYAYKSLLDDKLVKGLSPTNMALIQSMGDVDKKQYVVHNANGLFLTLEKDTYVTYKNPYYDENLLDNTNPNYYPTELRRITKNVDRVEISWNGLVLRNFNGDEVFKADPNSGDLKITGTVTATDGNIGGWSIKANGFNSEGVTISSNGSIESNNVYINANIQDANPSSSANNGADRYYNIFVLGDLLLAANSASKRQYIKYLKHIYLNDLLEDTTNHIFSIGDKLIYTIDNNTSNLVIDGSGSFSGVLSATSLEAVCTSGKFKATSSNLGFYDSSDNAVMTLSSNTMTIASNYTLDINGNINIAADNLVINSNPSNNDAYFRLGASDNALLTYNDNGLDITGSLTTDSLTVGSINNALTYSSSTGLKIGSSTDYLTYDSGTLTVKGALTADTLTVGSSGNVMKYDSTHGLNIGNGKLTYNNNNLYIGSSSGNHIKYGPDNGLDKLSIQVDSLTLNGGSLVFASNGSSTGISLAVDSSTLNIWGSSSHVNTSTHMAINDTTCSIAASTTVSLTADNSAISMTTGTISFSLNNISKFSIEGNDIWIHDTAIVKIKTSSTEWKSLLDYIRHEVIAALNKNNLSIPDGWSL